MGDRRMAEIRTSEGSLYIYTHWHGSQLPDMAIAAVEKARPRLGDEPYWTRIVVDQLIKPGRDSELGFGLMLEPNCEDSYSDNGNTPTVIISAKKGSVKVIHGTKKY